MRELGRLPEALASYKRALEIRPGYADARYGMGNALLDLGRHPEAAEAYEKVLASNARPDYIAGNLAWVRMRCCGEIRSRVKAAFERLIDVRN